MVRRNVSSSTPANAESMGYAPETKPAAGNVSKVILVKPVQQESAPEKNSGEDVAETKLSIARPKIGRFPVQVASAQEGNPKEVAFDNDLPTEEPRIPEDTSIVKKAAFDWNSTHQSSSWDFKFALFLVVLLVLVNVGLMTLLHHNPKPEAIVAIGRPHLVQSTPSAAVSVVETPHVALPSIPPAPQSAGIAAVSSPFAVPPAVKAVPASVRSVEAPAASPLSSPSSAAAKQDLLSIISKD